MRRFLFSSTISAGFSFVSVSCEEPPPKAFGVKRTADGFFFHPLTQLARLELSLRHLNIVAGVLASFSDYLLHAKNLKSIGDL